MNICMLLLGTTYISHILNISSGINTSSEASHDASDASHILDLAPISKATNTLNIAIFNLKLSNCPIKKY